MTRLPPSPARTLAQLIVLTGASLIFAGCAAPEPAAPTPDLAADGYTYEAENEAWVKVREVAGCAEEGCVSVEVVAENCGRPVLTVLGRASDGGPVLWDQIVTMDTLFPGETGSILVGYSHPATQWVEATITRCDGH